MWWRDGAEGLLRDARGEVGKDTHTGEPVTGGCLSQENAHHAQRVIVKYGRKSGSPTCENEVPSHSEERRGRIEVVMISSPP